MILVRTFGPSARRTFPILLALAGLSLAGACGGSENTMVGGPQAPVVLDPQTRMFPDTMVGQTSAPLMFTVRNAHSSALPMVGVTTTGAAADQFVATGCSGMLNRNQSCIVMVVFKPTRAGDLMANLEISAGGGRKVAALVGKANRPAVLTAGQADISFGSITVGTASEAKMVMIKNDGTLLASGLDVKVNGDGFEKMGGTCGPMLAAGTTCLQPVIFRPTSVGPKTGTLVASLGGTVSVMIELAGNGVARAAVLAAPSAVEFDPVGVGRTGRAITVNVTNPGAAPVAMFRATSNSMDFTVVNNCPGTIAPSGSCAVQVSFAPKSVGAKRGELALSVTGGDAVGVPLSGMGVPAAALVLGPERPSFVPVPVGTATPELVLTVRNDGQEEIEELKPESSDPRFSLKHNCGMRLPANGSCMLTVVFTPSAEGAAMATIKVGGKVRGMAITSAETVVSGLGIPRPSIIILPLAHDFGRFTVGQQSPTASFAVSNTGGVASGPLRVTTQNTDFKVVPGTDACQDRSIEPGGHCTISVVFTPGGAGPRSSPLTVVSDRAGTTGAMLSGQGAVGAVLALDQAAASFGTVGLGQVSSEVIFTVTNRGDAESGVVQLATGSAQFLIGANGCQNQTLTPNESCSVAVRFAAGNIGDFTTDLRASANPGGAATATLTATGAMPASIAFQEASGANVSVLNFSAIAVGSESMPGSQVFVRNTGMTSTGMLATVIQGTHPGDFAILPGSNTCGAPLAPGGQCSMTLVFKPTAAGDRDATVNVTAGSGGVASLLLQGSARGLLQVQNPPGTQVTTFNFGELTAGLVGAEETFTVAALVNTGTYTVSFDGAGSPPNFARAGGDCESTPQLAAGATCTIRVRFQPQSAGAKTGSLAITTSDGVTARVVLTGTGTGPLQFSPRPHNFGDRPAGSTTDQVFELANRGPHPMSAVSVSLMGSSDYVVTADTCAGAPPASNGSCTVTVRFIPTTPGAKATTLSAAGTFMVAGANQTDTAAVNISGNATPAAQIAVDPATHDFGMVAVGSTGVAQAFRVSNAADRPATGAVQFDTSQATGDFAITRNGCLLADNVTPRPLAAGENCTFEVRFTPGATGSRAGVIRAFAEPGGSVAVRLGGTGLSTLVIEPGAQDLDAGGNLNVAGQTNRRFEFQISNRGAAPVALATALKVTSVVGATGDGPTYFALTPSVGAPCPATLAGGASCRVEVAMTTPAGATPGKKYARLEATGTPAATTTAVSELSGTLRADAAVSYVDGNAGRDFGGVKVGQVSGPHLVQVQNTGGVTAGALQIAVPANFELVLTSGTNPDTGNPVCVAGNPLDPNAICDIVLRFRPNTALGPLAGTLRVSATGFGAVSGNQDKALTGVGLPVGGIYLSPNPADFGSATPGAATPIEQAFTLTNETGVNVAVAADAVSAVGPGFSVASSTCTPGVNAGATCTITARFQPAQAAAVGTVVGSLVVVGTPAGAAAQTATATLQGRVVLPVLRIEAPPEGANWGEALVGLAATARVFTVRNVGGAATSAAPAVAVSGPQAADFAIPAGPENNTCTAALPANGACTVTIVLTPAAIAGRAATLGASVGGVSASIGLSASAVLPSAIQVVSIGGAGGDGTTVDFASKAVGSETGVDVVIRNVDNGQRIAAPTFTLGDPVNFRFDTNPGTAGDCFERAQDGLDGGPPGESCTVRIFFRPQSLPAAGPAAPNMTTTLIVGGAGSGLTLSLRGNAVSALAIDPGERPFGSLAVNATSGATTFTVTNSSDAGIPATGQVAVSVDGTDAASFRITRNTCAGNTLPPGGRCEIDVVFEPKAAGARTATLSVIASPTNGASAALTGSGT
jgi:hypothetical protein